MSRPNFTKLDNLDDSVWLTVAEAAEYTGKHESTIRRFISDGKFTGCRKVANVYYIPVPQIKQLVEEV